VFAPGSTALEVVCFGQTLTVRDNRGVEARYGMVGAEEAHFDRSDVSWLSPIARASLNVRGGDTVRFKEGGPTSTGPLPEAVWSGVLFTFL
jgi:transcription elongation GreA/GreB family factor